MKKLLTTLFVTAGLLFASVSFAAETTKVCVDVKDKSGNTVKDAKGNVKQNCKEMKVHKKLEGTAIPVKK